MADEIESRWPSNPEVIRSRLAQHARERELEAAVIARDKALDVAERQAEKEANDAADLLRLRTELRLSYRGSDQDFEKALPALIEQVRQVETLGRMAAAREAARANVRRQG